MGNQLVGIAPSQIYPVEHYFTDHPELHFDVNLGSTRFFKVARVQSQEGLVVVKVFVIHDPTLPLTTHRIRIEEIKSKLSSAVNCLPYRKALLTDRAAYLMREYVKYSLYDRLSTRPFLTTIEKKWLAFQILYALHQCHKVGICHGDVKLENVMVTSWHWILLTDFASFKPTYLPDDNPADFSFFFDTSRRRACYIAPERFVRSLNTESYQQVLILNEDTVKAGELTPAMDIFSAGCVLAELFSDGQSPFDLSQLLTYRNADEDYKPSSLSHIEDLDIRELICAMIQREPANRLTAELYLDQQRGKIFPEYFYTFLQSYMLMFSNTSPILSPDEKVERLRKDIENVITLMEKAEYIHSSSNTEDGKKCESLVLITALVTSCVRGLRLSSAKLQALEMLYLLSERTSVEILLDRIVPHIVYLLQDECPRVRISAIYTINKSLMLVTRVPASDANIFPEYVLPSLTPMAQDETVVVRAALAQTIAQIAETALRFLEFSQCNRKEKEEGPTRSYESEVTTLHEMIQQCVSALLTDTQNIVRRTLMENGIVKLCVFFGKHKANDVLLSHMITFLNDKADKQLKASFFDVISSVAGFIGVHCSPILTPLLQQGFTDSEEFVTRKALIALSQLTELGLLYKSALYELLNDVCCFLIHPNLWIRQAMVGFINTLTKVLNIVDVQCKITPVIEPYLKHPVIQLDQQILVMNAMRSPIPRIIYDATLKYVDLELFFQTLIERQRARSINKGGHIPSSSCIPQSVEQNSTFQHFFRRLSSEGMNETVEDKLLLMSNYLRKLHKYHSSNECMTKQSSKLDVSHLQHKLHYHTVTLVNVNESNKENIVSSHKKRTTNEESASTSMNEEWKHMFGSNDVSPNKMYSQDSQSATTSTKKSFTFTNSDINQDTESSVQERSYIHYRYPPCRLELGKLIQRKQEQYDVVLRTREWVENEAWVAPLPPPGWKLKSNLVAHLHEHKSAVNRLVTIPDTGIFTSCSSDGCVRLWDCGKMEGRNIANRSRQMYNARSGPLTSMTVCRNNQSLATVASNGSVILLNVDGSSSKMTLLNSRQLDLQDEGCAVDIAYFDPGSQSVVVYVTMYGSLIGWDLRAYGNAWKIDNQLRQGVITTMCVDSLQNCVILGTGCGYHTCVDLRFRLPISSIVHPHGNRVRRIIRHPKEPSWIISAVQGNNEVSIWNMETGFQQMSFWASDSPPLSKPVDNQHGICALYPCTNERYASFLAAGTDRRVRKWSLSSLADECHIAIPAASDFPMGPMYTYENRLVDGTRVIQEHSQASIQKEKTSTDDKQSLNNETVRTSAGPEQPATGHRDTISDITMCHTTQCFLITSSRDGVIKVWK